MTSGKIQLEIVTPSRLFFSGEVESVTLPGIEGYMGILPQHAPLLSELKTGLISYLHEGRQVTIFNRWGFVEVLPDRVAVLSDLVETADEIDVERARQDKESAEQILAEKSAEIDYKAALASLEQAVARLEVAGKAEK